MQGNRWIEVDLDKVVHNYKQVKGLLQENTKIMAVVKADAYGLGAVPVALALETAGADMFGVTSLEEGLELRRAGLKTPVLVFAPLLEMQMEEAVRAGLAVTVSSPEHADLLGRIAGRLKTHAAVHIKVETGMGRTGVFPELVLGVVRRVTGDEWLDLQGIYTHFPRAADKKMTERQYRVFSSVVDELCELGYEIPLVHCCNSTATLMYPHMHRSMVRVGTILYGQYPGGGSGQLDLQDPWSARARVIYLRRVPRGTGIGYGHEYVTKRETYIGIIPLGFSDGYGVAPVSRAKSPVDLIKMIAKTLLTYFGWQDRQLRVSVGERSYPVVGRVGMQLSMVDFGTSPEVAVGDEVAVFLRRTTAAKYLERRYWFQGQWVNCESLRVGENGGV
ncbi:MAG: alanine racemase [Thermoanaerobacteraceae bacterium]|nr:alanine racemase [Thermoanaerobacteraceae bacterium]